MPIRLPFLIALAPLAACGSGGDTTTDPDDAAPAAAIERSVSAAEREAVDAGLEGRGLPNTAAGEAALAEEMISSARNDMANDPLDPPMGPAAGPSVGATRVDPSTGDPMPPVQPRGGR